MTSLEMTIAAMLVLIVILLPVMSMAYLSRKKSFPHKQTLIDDPELEIIHDDEEPSEVPGHMKQTKVLSGDDFVPQTGDKIGSYTVSEVIGTGGMGKIIKALSADRRTVAIKIMKPEHSGNQALVNRFKRELKIVSLLSHENIARLFEWGEHDGRKYFVMEYVDGVNLRELLKHEKPSVSRALDIVKQVCKGLGYAHAKNVIHRDIKPENILVNRNGCVKIVDFGIARLDDDGITGSSLTLTNIAMGSPLYMSPEQKSDFKHVDHRADIYSLGVMLYEMLSGELPGSLLRIDLIPSGLRKIIQKSSSYYPDDRYISMKEMLDDLSGYEVAGDMARDQNALEEIGEGERLRQVLINALYPKEIPQYFGFDIASLYLAASGVGGNYYDFMRVDESSVGILVGNVFERPDVKSAIFLAMLRSAFRMISPAEKDPGKVFKKLNSFISAEKFDLFAVFSYLICDTDSKILRLSTAGYRPVGILGAAEESFRYLQSDGIGIGITADAVFGSVEYALAAGDIVILSSAGAPETRNLAGEAYGQERFEKVIMENRTRNASQIADAVRKNLAHFAAGVALQDDITVVVMKVLL